ncbi:MAG: DUF4332 domain-containing protein [Planctomycetaceae bacterium]
MRLTDIQINGFGVLKDLTLADIAPGLQVIHGANGSGKTTILHFIRGVFCGFADARRLKLLPPVKGGTPGGSLGVRYRDAHYSAIRHVRPDEMDALAINHTHGKTSDVPGLRSEFQRVDIDSFSQLFAVGNYESHALEPLVRLALRDNIPLRGKTESAHWLVQRLESVRKEREDLFTGTPSKGKIEELQARKAELTRELGRLSAERESQHDSWAGKVRQLENTLKVLQHRINWLHGELQQVQSDLNETHDRLWSRRVEVVREEQIVERPGASTTPDWIVSIREIDEQIRHSQQVLKDLAASRMQVSVKTAGLAGVEIPEVETYFQRHREAIRQLERQTERFALIEQTLDSARSVKQCVCDQLTTDISSTLQSIRQQIYLICQELSRQQSVHHQVLLQSQRESIDACELEVTRQIQRLRLRRDQLLHEAGRTSDELLQHRTLHDAEHCRCDNHTTYVNGLPASVVAGTPIKEVIVNQRTREVSNARPGDADLAARLNHRKRQLQRDWWATQSEWCRIQGDLRELLKQPHQFAADSSLDALRYELSVVSQRLADAREQWQSLAMLQQVLQSTEQKLKVETESPVIKESSRLLNRLTSGRYPRFLFETEGSQLLVQNDSGEKLPLHILSRGTLDQAAFAFRLALWKEYVGRGVKLPLLLDDVLNDSDEDRLKIAVDVLIEYSQVQQIVFFTCQEHLANLFDEAGAAVRDLPGSSRGRVMKNKTRPLPSVAVAVAQTETVETVVQPSEREVILARTQPDQPYWLQADSSILNVPSLSVQMARRLNTLGVRDVADLLDLDASTIETPLENLQISVATLRLWQAECRLLVCVAGLSGRDAQVLAATGITNASELAEVDAEELSRRIEQLRYRSGEHMALTWIPQARTWPSHNQVGNWRHSAQRARSYRAARESVANRRAGRRSGRRSAERSQRGYAFESRGRRVSERSQSNGRPSVRMQSLAQFHQQSHERTPANAGFSVVSAASSESSEAKELRFFLNLDSPVVDAPSIGPKMAGRLEKIGVRWVSDLLNRDAGVIAEKLDLKRVKEADVVAWQRQASLMTAVPEMRGHDVQVLVALDIHSPSQLASYSPESLFAIVGPFVETNEGQRLLRSSKVPDLEEVTDWIRYAHQSRSLKAA